VVAVAEVLKPRRLFEFFAAHRARLGMTIYPAEGGVTSKLVAAVRRGSIVAIVGDRDLRGFGQEVEFFGETTTMPTGPAAIALRAQAPLLVVGIYGTRLSDGRRAWEAYISDPIEVPAERTDEAVNRLTREIAARLEDFIRRRPEEWHVFQPFWPSDKAKAKNRL
jgi:KDO2-lipid IV(A) lauroyltransferase